MSRNNLILLAVFIVLLAVYLFGGGPEYERTGGPAPRLFPDFNKEAADRIEIDGGWPGTRWEFGRSGSDWRLASAGDYPLKAEAMRKFLDAVASLRRENPVGSSESVQAETGTDAKQGRRVRVFQGETAMADFVVGNNPKGYSSYQEFFVRAFDDATVYRTRTIATGSAEQASFDAGGPQGFGWHNYVNKLSTEWIDSKVWDLSDAETEELWLTRGRELDVRLVKKADDKWDLVETGKEPVPGDADAADSITSQLRYLYNNGVVGKFDDVGADYGLDKPGITLVLTLKKKVEEKKQEGGAKTEGEAKKEGETEKGGEKEPSEEKYVTFKRTIEVGKKFTRPRDYDRETGKTETEDLYPIRIGGDFDDPEEERRSEYVFLVSDYRVAPLKKDLEELKSKEPEKEPEEEKAPEEEEPSEAGGSTAEKPPEKPAEEPAKSTEPQKPSDDTGKDG